MYSGLPSSHEGVKLSRKDHHTGHHIYSLTPCTGLPLRRFYGQLHNVDFEQIAKEFWDKHEKRIKPFYKEIQKEDDLLITASPSFLAEEICRRIGIKHCLSTQFDIKTGKFVRACFREKKIDFLLEAYPDGQIDDFYTDSMNDKFLFPYAKRVFMVKGNKITRIK